ncbi:MAG TPA: WXG100 family type VII secretion target [Actinocrinis sp.]|nr:WXG100 family type VII secretion target [Actinocrinis sp.]
MIGADPDQLDALSGRMGTAARRLGEIRGELDSALRRFEWEGGDAAEFHDEWATRLAPLVVAAVSALDDAAKSLTANARQQREASGDPGSSGAPPLLTLVAAGAGGSAVFGALKTVNNVSSKADLLISVAEQTKLDDHIPGLGVADHALGGIGLAIDGVTLIHGLATDPHGRDTYNAEVETAIDATSMAVSIACPPAGIAVAAAGFVYEDVLEKHFPDLSKNIVDGVGAAATAVGKTYVDAAETDLKAADAAGRVISSGVHGVLSHIHF